MTSLIDVIFLLLLFFMLSSTFARFAEVELTAGGQGGAAQAEPQTIAFLRISDDGMSLNGAAVPVDALPEQLAALKDTRLLVAVTRTASAQSLTDVLVAARASPDLLVTVLEAS